jgi:prepilin-type N-terminal cleavage/methylation domain-containing protein
MDDLYNRVARRHRSGEGGFTLIELLVVIAVLAILGAIVIFNVTGVANRGKQSACDTDVKTIQTAVDTVVSDNGGQLGFLNTNNGGDMGTNGDLAALQSNGYIHSVPTSCVGGFFITAKAVSQGTPPVSVTVYDVTGKVA